MSIRRDTGTEIYFKHARALAHARTGDLLPVLGREGVLARLVEAQTGVLDDLRRDGIEPRVRSRNS